MNIAVIGKFFTEASGLHIEEALLNMGHNVIKIDPESKYVQSGFLGEKIKNITKTIYNQILIKIPVVRRINSKSIYKIYNANKIELTIVLHDFLSKQEVDHIKKTNNSPLVLWFPDAISNFQKGMFFVAGYDYLFFTDKYIVEKLKSELDLNTHYLPICCNPTKHKPVKMNTNDESLYSCDIVNAGNLYPSRAALYKQLTNYNFKVWGPPPAIWLNMPELDFMIMGNSVHNDEKSKAFSAAKICLNNLHPAVINGSNKRAFEIAACGGFQITTHSKAISELFEIGKEIITYHNLTDLKKKIDYYLDPKNEEERQKIADAGYKRAIKEHTYDNRLTELINICKPKQQ